MATKKQKLENPSPSSSRAFELYCATNVDYYEWETPHKELLALLERLENNFFKFKTAVPSPVCPLCKQKMERALHSLDEYKVDSVLHGVGFFCKDHRPMVYCEIVFMTLEKFSIHEVEKDRGLYKFVDDKLRAGYLCSQFETIEKEKSAVVNLKNASYSKDLQSCQRIESALQNIERAFPPLVCICGAETFRKKEEKGRGTILEPRLNFECFNGHRRLCFKVELSFEGVENDERFYGGRDEELFCPAFGQEERGEEE